MAKPVRIFIVEDDEIISHLMQQILSLKGYEITGFAASADEVFAKIPSTPCDVILMDIGLKGDTDGITAARILSARIRTPIIFVTGQFDDQILERAKTPNTYGYIIKPFTANDLSSAIEIALFNYRLRGQAEPQPASTPDPAAAKQNLPAAAAIVQIPARTHVRTEQQKKIYDHAVFYQSRGNYQRALQHIIELLEQDPADASAWAEKGDMLHNMGRTDDALAAIDTALGIDPSSGYALCKKSRILCGAGRFAEALKAIEISESLIRDNREILVEKGMILHEMGRTDEALGVLDRAISLNRKCGYALGAKGRLLSKIGMNKEALAEFGKALAIEPKNVSLWMDLVRLFEQKRNYHSALNVLHMAMEKNPENEILVMKRDCLLNKAIPAS